MSDLDLDELRSELDEFAPPEKKGGRPSREERIIAGFEEIQRFTETHGHAPQHGEDRDIFERLYAVRLDRLRALDESRSLLAPIDHQGLLAGALISSTAPSEAMDDDELLAELEGAAGSSDITKLRHVRTSAEKREAEEIASREKCLDFEKFKPLFQQVQSELDNGLRTTRPFVKDAGFLKAEIKAGQFFILGGQTAYVAEIGEPFKAPNGEADARLRVIYSNGTESDLLLRSLQRALYKDEAGRRITEPIAGPLFADKSEDGDRASGTIYVLRSMADHPTVVAHRGILHKIGVTSGNVERRIANARLDPTFLMADVEIVATYELFNINRSKLENVIHRVFSPARLDVEIKDRFGQPIVPREWFLVPLFAIDEAVVKIKDGTITGYVYDPKTAKLILASSHYDSYLATPPAPAR
jgi:Meiotically up-regulated gene 113